MGRWKKILVLVVLIGVLIRLTGIVGSGTGDLAYFKGWGMAVVDVGLTNVYPPYAPEVADIASRYKLPVNYPPGTAFYLGTMAKVFLSMPEGVRTDGVYDALIKLPAILADLLAGILLFRHVRKRYPEKQAVLTFAAYWLNPALIYAGAFLGYQDSITITLCFAVLLLALESRIVSACALFAVALLTKQLALFIFPVLIMFLVRATERRRALAGAAAFLFASGVILAPFILTGKVSAVYNYLSQVSVHASLSANALNVWWIFTSIIEALYQVQFGVPLLPQLLDLHITNIETTSILLHSIARGSYVLFTMVNVVFLLLRDRSAKAYMGAAALQFYGYAMLMTGVHENHFLYIPIFMAALIVETNGMRYLYGAVSTLAFMNLFWFYGLTGEQHFFLNWRSFYLVAFFLALANFGLFCWTVIAVWRGDGGDGAADHLPAAMKPLFGFQFGKS